MTEDPQILIVGGGRRGRPPRAGVTAQERIEFLVTAEERSALEKVASENSQTLAGVIRDAVNTFVADYADRVVFTPSGDRFHRKKQ